jgi:hypothetical protein
MALDVAPIAQETKARLWDAYQSAQTPQEFAAAMDKMPVPTRVKSVLWDIKAKAPAQGATDEPAFADLSFHDPSQESPYGPTVTDRAVNTLPTVGGLTGGLIGARAGVTGAIGGATLGGSAGEATKELINRVRGVQTPDTPLDAAKAIGTEGAIQGGVQAIGEAIPGAANWAGKTLMENAIRPAIGLAKEFPGIVETAIHERLPVGSIIPGLAKGSEQAVNALGAAGASVRDLLNKATTAGTKFYASNIAQPVLDLVDEIAKQPLGDAAEHRLGEMLDEFLTRHPGPLTPVDVKALKKAAQDIAEPIYKAKAAGNVPGAEQELAARFNSKIAQGAKTSLETIPGVAAGEAKTQELIGATKAIKQAELRRMSLMAESLSGAAGTVASLLGPRGEGSLPTDLRNGAITWLVTRGLMSPKSTSRAALALTQPQMQALFRQFPRLAYAVVQQLQSKPTGTDTQTEPLGTLDLQ